MRRTFSPRNVLFAIVVLVLVGSIPFALRETYQTGEIYIFPHRFLNDIPKRLSGPGRLRFILQPLIAILLGIRGGIADAHSGRPPFILGLLARSEHRSMLVRTGMSQISVLVAVAILLDTVSQFLIFRQVHPGAALIVVRF